MSSAPQQPVPSAAPGNLSLPDCLKVFKFTTFSGKGDVEAFLFSFDDAFQLCGRQLPDPVKLSVLCSYLRDDAFLCYRTFRRKQPQAGYSQFKDHLRRYFGNPFDHTIANLEFDAYTSQDNRNLSVAEYLTHCMLLWGRTQHSVSEAEALRRMLRGLPRNCRNEVLEHVVAGRVHTVDLLVKYARDAEMRLKLKATFDQAFSRSQNFNNPRSSPLNSQIE
jgi:hypothetical protein